jgi:hypothetical protein
MANVARSPNEVLEDITAFALSSDALMAKARALRVGESLSFVPSAIVDGSPMQQVLATSIKSPFTVRRIELDEVPPEYEFTPDDLAGQLAFLVASAIEPERRQLAVISSSGRAANDV